MTEPTDIADDPEEFPPVAGLFESSPHAVLGAIGAAAGLIAVATIAVEILTFRFPARLLGFQSGFVSVPMGAAAAIIGGLTSQSSIRYALPAIGLGALYWGLFVVFI